MAVQYDISVKNPVPQETTFHYTNKYLGQELEFTPVADEVVVALSTDASTDLLHDIASDASVRVQVADVQRGFAIVAVDATSDAMGSASGPTAPAGMGNSLPVMIDADGNRRCFMPDEFTVQFSDDCDADRCAKVLADHNCNIVERHRTPGYFTVSVPDGRGLFDMIRVISKDDSVVFAEPSEIGLEDALGTSARRHRGLTNSARSQPLTNDGVPVAIGLPSQTGPGMWRPEVFRVAQGWQAPLTNQAPAPGLLAHETDTVDLDDYPQLWALRNTGQTVEGATGRPDADIDADQAWAITQGSSSAVVVVIDTGADVDHPDLVNQMVPRGEDDWDFADPYDDIPEDPHGHGTHVSGTAVGDANGSGVVGVAPGAQLMPLRINLMAGMNANRADAINYVTATAKADSSKNYVVNCSWGASGNVAAILYAIRRAAEADVLIIFAAGNSNQDMDVRPAFPGSYPEVMCVAASDQRDQRASFSNYGSAVDIMAPGVNIMSSVPDDDHAFFNGTSMAAPHVAGAAALVWSRNPGLSAQQVRDILEGSCDNVDAQNPDMVGKLGAGRLNAYQAVRRTAAPTITPEVVREIPFPVTGRGASLGLTFAPRMQHAGVATQSAVVFCAQQVSTPELHFVNARTGREVLSVVPAGHAVVTSLAWCDRLVAMANVEGGSGQVDLVEPRDGRVVSSFPLPSGLGEGLAFDGVYFYYSTQTRIHKLDGQTGRVMASFPAPGGRCRALACSKKHLLVGDSTANKVYGYSVATGLVDYEIQLPATSHQRVEAMAFDARREELYVADAGAGVIHVLRVPQP